ncbi:hypothetical protein ACFQGS_23325 [Novosphingobium lubricantis]
MAPTASDTAAERRTMTGESWADAVSAALDWWHDAGVDCAFLDTPRDWLAAASAGAQTDPHAPQRSVQALPAEADRPRLRRWLTGPAGRRRSMPSRRGGLANPRFRRPVNAVFRRSARHRRR